MPAQSTLFPYTTLFRSEVVIKRNYRIRSGSSLMLIIVLATEIEGEMGIDVGLKAIPSPSASANVLQKRISLSAITGRSEEHTSELQSHSDLVCRLLLEK